MFDCCGRIAIALNCDVGARVANESEPGSYAQPWREFDDVVLVAPRRSLGELRGLLSKRVLSRVRLEIPKDLTNKSPVEIWRRLAPLARRGL